jgi:hypothetical protein
MHSPSGPLGDATQDCHRLGKRGGIPPFGPAVLEALLSGPYRDVRPFVSYRPGSLGGSNDIWVCTRSKITGRGKK